MCRVSHIIHSRANPEKNLIYASVQRAMPYHYIPLNSDTTVQVSNNVEHLISFKDRIKITPDGQNELKHSSWVGNSVWILTWAVKGSHWCLCSVLNATHTEQSLRWWLLISRYALWINVIVKLSLHLYWNEGRLTYISLIYTQNGHSQWWTKEKEFCSQFHTHLRISTLQQRNHHMLGQPNFKPAL